MLQKPSSGFQEYQQGVGAVEGRVMEMESHEPMKCHTESSIATLIPQELLDSPLISFLMLSASLVHCSGSYSLGQLYMGSS